MKAKAPPPAPEYLTTASKHFWAAVTERYLLEAHELKLLEFACMALDRIEAGRQAIATDGAFIVGQRGRLVAHPATKVIKDSEDSFRLILGKLDLKHVGV
jgi:phage terminase small subunit